MKQVVLGSGPRIRNGQRSNFAGLGRESCIRVPRQQRPVTAIKRIGQRIAAVREMLDAVAFVLEARAYISCGFVIIFGKQDLQFGVLRIPANWRRITKVPRSRRLADL